MKMRFILMSFNFRFNSIIDAFLCLIKVFPVMKFGELSIYFPQFRFRKMKFNFQENEIELHENEIKLQENEIEYQGSEIQFRGKFI